jgi:hypothetical protein|eukprot:COSAG06_NODE_2922_length_6086_cov_12.303658_8_plen_82_part_00
MYKWREKWRFSHQVVVVGKQFWEGTFSGITRIGPKNAFFGAIDLPVLLCSKRSICQDRLGTNTLRQIEKQEVFFFFCRGVP